MAKKSTQGLGSPSAEAPAVSLTTYFAILNGVQDQIKFADRKAAFLSALNALLFGFASTGMLRLAEAAGTQGIAFWAACILVALYILAAGFSVGLVVASVMSRFGELAPRSKVYFGHIIHQYGKDYGKYVKEMKAMSDDDWAEEIGTQIVEVSHIAVTKHNLLKNAAKWSLAAFVLWIAALVAIAFVSLPQELASPP